MKKVLIGVNTFLNCNENLIKILTKETDRNCDYWIKNMVEDADGFRTKEEVHRAVKKYNFIIGESFGEVEKVKIVEIPDGVEWFVTDFECNVGEYVCEKYRTWS